MNRLLCYAHFDVAGKVRPFVLHALEVMQPLCADLVFISNSPLTDGDRIQLEKICAHLIVNNNTGYDFYMWKLGMESVDMSLYDEVVLMNSSVFGPLFSMEEVFERMSLLACDFWGITECFQMQPHIQTYFLVFKKRVTESAAFRSFWEGILPYTNKLQVIQSYEVGLTQWLVESGFQPGVVCSFNKMGAYCNSAGKRLRKKDNASVKFAAELLNAGSPFLKRDAVRNRKVNMGVVFPLLQALGYQTAFIDEKQHADIPLCPLCGAKGRQWRKGVRNFINLHDVERYDYFRCISSNCGVVWLRGGTPFPRPAVMGMVTEDEKLVGTIKLTLPRDANRLRPGKLLVIGEILPDGFLSLEKLGWEVSGVRITNQGALQLQDELYDYIVVINGLELAQNAKEVLVACHRLLKKGGTFSADTTNVDALLGRFFRGYWSRLNAPYNRMMFSKTSLKSMVASVGFADVRVRTGFCQTAQNFSLSISALRNKWIRQTFPLDAMSSATTGAMHCTQLSRIWSFMYGDVCHVTAVKR